ncbi:DNA mismatch repair protein MutS2 [Sporobacter termitidis DSM 10068]|uniref:Endonuclease MutS2 n=1 Tax=Sporobacter termitidis DSM 10068 TaxID=1123282 RepID=A0A1M5WZR9_9FIRM|nr:endonuclease MutS2 [Sporobacter termitidis]SHH92674.1 DNA mismatch repair protein MutS2 [Sporobacter termitidis DSM 10068]
MTLYEKSLKTLELPAVLQMLAGEAVSGEAKEAALALAPVSDVYEVRYRLEETTAAKKMMTLHGSPSFSGVKDVRSAVRRADISGMLNTVELLDIAALLRCAAGAISYASGDRAERTAIDALFDGLAANKFLEGKISASIVGPDEIADAASTELADIRRHMRVAGDKIRQSLNRIISSPAYSKALQEPIITVKNDRYVVPVKAEQKSAVPGLVHDVSSSGATFFIEPMAVVQLNNEIRELLSKEKKEIERILQELSADVSNHGEGIITDFTVLSALDLIFAKAKLSYRLNAAEPEISENGRLTLRRARHPLLDPKKAVPIDIRLGGDFDTLIITGPNTGGKTVTLKTLGLLSAMTYCGLHIPADDGSMVPVYGQILADIGDEQSIEQSLSTFSSHMTNIVKILEECDGASLLLFDELGAGTDPVEGAALAIAIIEYARGAGARLAATTHYAELKVFALTTKGVMNASCEFDVETLKPTYKLLIGVPGKSNAFAISGRLGLPEAIIDEAKKHVNSESASFEEVLESLEDTRRSMENERLETRRLLREAEEKARRAEEDRGTAAQEREKASRTARREANRILQEARRTADDVMEELKALRAQAASGEDWQRVNAAKSGVFRRLNEAESAMSAPTSEETASAPTRPAAPGDKVRLLGLGTTADVISVNADGVLSLQAGVMKITARPEEVELVEGETQRSVKKILAKSSAQMSQAQARPEIDLRGMMTDEAVPILERYLDTARMGKLNVVTVIHGKGTGALRAAVHQSLKHDPNVKSYRLGHFGEGEMGVTIVELKP